MKLKNTVSKIIPNRLRSLQPCERYTLFIEMEKQSDLKGAALAATHFCIIYWVWPGDIVIAVWQQQRGYVDFNKLRRDMC